MEHVEYNKLVRDYIPYLMAKEGLRPIVEILDDDRFLEELLKKLDEEVTELKQAIEFNRVTEETNNYTQVTTAKNNIMEEMADVRAVLLALAAMHNIHWHNVESMLLHKEGEKGSFSRRIFLLHTIDERTNLND